MALCREFSTISFVIAYEDGELEHDAIIDGFQGLIDNGIAWQLQGCYGRQAAALIEAGRCVDTHGVLG